MLLFLGPSWINKNYKDTIHLAGRCLDTLGKEEYQSRDGTPHDGTGGSVDFTSES